MWGSCRMSVLSTQAAIPTASAAATMSLVGVAVHNTMGSPGRCKPEGGGGGHDGHARHLVVDYDHIDVGELSDQGHGLLAG